MTSPGIVEGFNMPINVDQLTGVVNSLVEVTSANAMASVSGNTLMSSPSVVGAGESSDSNNSCLSQVMPSQNSAVLDNNMSSVHIPVSFTSQTVSMVPLMLSLNLANRSLIPATDKNSIDRGCLPTAPAPISLPSVSMSVVQNQVDDCTSALNSIDSMSCIQTAENTSPPTNIQQVSYSSAMDNQINTQSPGPLNGLISTSVPEALSNASLMTPDLSNLTDLRLGIGLVSQPETYTALPDSLSPLLQVTNHFGQGQTQKNSVTAATPCIVQSIGNNQTLGNTLVSSEESLPANTLQPLLHQRPSELTNSLDTFGLIPDKDNHNLVNSAMVLDVANMSVIDMILKVQHAETNNNNFNSNEKILECEEMTQVELEGDNSSVTLNITPQIAFGHFCLDCNAQLKEPCQIHNNDFSEIPDSPIITRARISLPSLLYLKNTSAQGYNDDLGVWSNAAIPKKSRFGPLTAKVKSKCQVNCEKTTDFPIWMIFFPEETLADVLDVSDENECNWMMFVKPARNVAEQNLVAYQHSTNIYFITCCDIQPHEELLVWYSKDYAKAIGVPVKTDVTLNCSVCDKIFASHKLLAQHLKDIHPEVSVRRWRCQFCSRGFTSTTKLKTHLLTHIGVKPHSCAQCGKQFTDQSNLRMHQMIHTGERKFSCYVCQKQFRQKAHLKSHMFMHTGEKSLKCQFCEKMFSRSSDLKQHEYQHTKEKIFCCPHCDKSFYKMQNFKKHLKIHSGERNYSCTMCSKSFYTKYHLKRHSSSCKGTKSVICAGAMVVVSEDVGLTLDDATDIVNKEAFKEDEDDDDDDDEEEDNDEDDDDRIKEENEDEGKTSGEKGLSNIDFIEDQL